MNKIIHYCILLGCLLAATPSLLAQQYSAPAMNHCITMLSVDSGWIQSSDMMSLGMHEAVRHPENPVLDVRPGMLDSDRASFPQWILLENGKFRMWYNALDDAGNWNTCYAESVDGVHWKRPSLGLHLYRGSTDNNIVIPGFNMAAPLRDDHDKNPARRYKTALARPLTKAAVDSWTPSIGGRQPGAGSPSVGGYAFSPDGIHWTVGSSASFAAGQRSDQSSNSNKVHFSIPVKQEAPSLLYYQGRYYLYSQMSNGDYPQVFRWSRFLGVSVSDDFVNWRLAKEPGFYFDPKYGSDIQTHGMLGYQAYDNTLVAAYGIMYYNTELLDHETDLFLLVSNDALHWRKPDAQPVSTILRRAPRGAWDGSFLTQANILNAGRKTFLYYGGKAELANLFYGAQATGLATWRLDGYGYLAPEVGWNYQNNQFTGSITGKPITIAEPNQKLFLNVRGSDRPGHIVRVELRDAQGQPLPGYSLEDCDPITQDSVGLPVTWNGNYSLNTVVNKQVSIHIQIEVSNPERSQMIRVTMPYFYAAYLDRSRLWLNVDQNVYPGRGLERVDFQDPDRPAVENIFIQSDRPVRVTMNALTDNNAIITFSDTASIAFEWPDAANGEIASKTIVFDNGKASFQVEPNDTLSITLKH